MKSTGSKVVITGAVEGSQAERVFEASGIRSFMQHATIVAVNGKSFKGVNEDGVINLLRGSRPLYITVRLSMNGWERLGIYRSIIAKEKSTGPVASVAPAVGTVSSLPINKRKLRVVSVVFQSGPLGGLDFRPLSDWSCCRSQTEGNKVVWRCGDRHGVLSLRK